MQVHWTFRDTSTL